MTDTIFVFLLYFTACKAASIANITDMDSTENGERDFYPNWVPFANKHGDELGEFTDVTVAPKAKVKKRLAPPANFLLRAVAEPEGDDYYEKGQGESDSEDYYEKKEWSDLNRPVVPVENAPPPKLNDLSDIDGVIHIITQERPSLAQAIEKSTQEQQRKEEKPDIKPEDFSEESEPQKTSIKKEINKPKEERKYEDEIDYEDSPQTTEKVKPEDEEEKAENEAKQKYILDSVDDLKERHAQEQRAISEKVKEEEFDQEVFERDQIQIKKQHDKYAERHPRKRVKVTPPDYDDYDDKASWRDKYEVKPSKTTPEPKPSTKIITAPGKVSVFRNPNLYIIDDDDNEVTTVKPQRSTEAPRRFSSKYNLATVTTERNLESDGPDQINLLPENNKGEPVLFFPKLKNKRKRKLRTNTVAPDSTVAETVADKTAEKLSTKANDLTETTGSDSTEDYRTTALGNDYKTTGEGEITTALENEPTARDGDFRTTAADSEVNPTATGPSGEAESTNTDAVTDAVPASTDHKKEEPKDYHVEKGGGHEHHSSHEEEHEEHGKKAYEFHKFPKMALSLKILTNVMELKGLSKTQMSNLKPWYYHYDIDGLHKDSKTKKGHHDKEDHLGKYEDHAGFDKKHHDEKNHYGSHHHEEHGKKHAKYEESGKHSKGHSTKGSHDIHKKEEYEKNVEFFEEEGDSEEEEKHGGYNQEREHSAGGKYKKGNLEAKNEERKKGESGHFQKAGHHFVDKGHKLSGGHDAHGKRGKTQHDAGGKQGGKKWVYHHGYPARTANLVVIDRRGDKYAHGPSYYG